MKKYIPLELSLAQRLAAVELSSPFCGFCRTERAAVEELKAVIAKPAAQLLFSPSLAHLEELEKNAGVGTVDECDPLDPAVLSAQMPGPAPAADGPNRQLMTYAMAASDKPQWECPAEPAGGSGKVHHPLHNIAEWRKGCSCATGHPSTCQECTEGLVQAIQSWFHQQVTAAQTHDLAGRIVDALLEDEKTEGFDLTAGMFGAAFSALVAELANQQDTIKEMGELIDQQAAELEALRKLTGGATLTHKTKGGYYRPLGEAAPAGAVKTMLNVPLSVYQDTFTGKLYYRSTQDFAAALEPL